MKYSAYNIFSKIKDSEDYFIVNLLSGNADILNSAEAANIMELSKQDNISERGLASELISKGYITEPKVEESLYRKKYLNFIDSREKEEIQLFFIANYSCNFSCSYCYQDQYSNPVKDAVKPLTDAFFSYIKTRFSERKKYITVFGGEPLLDSPKQKSDIEYIILKANETNLELSFVTNGYTLENYIEILKKARIREIQVTLDGTGEVHNKRRHLKNGGPTFDRIVRGIDACLENGIPVNLRMVIDKENIDNLPDLARFAIDKGWTSNKLFKTQVGRNYELHHCQSGSSKLFDRISLYENIYEIIKKHPHVLQFYKPAFSIAKFLFDNGSLPDPLFDACPACKSEWAFDYTGKIYSCTATVGKAGEALGTFYPEVKVDDTLIEKWQERDVISIPACRSCNLQLACGGGCGSVAKNNTGNICSSDCRPVKELLELGFASYITE